MNGSDLLVKCLKTEGVRCIFSLSGGQINPIYQSCLNEGIRIIDVRHEQAAAHMAEAWSRSTRVPGVCVVTAGPGVTNAVTGVVSAYLEGFPLIVISGATQNYAQGMCMQQELDQARLLEPVTKLSVCINHPERIPSYVSEAFRVSVSDIPGPAHLCIPLDVLKQDVSQSNFGFVPYSEYRPPPPEGDTGAIRQALKVLSEADRPVGIAGVRAQWCNASESLTELMELVKLPMFTIDNGWGTVSDEHPLCFGFASSLYNEAALGLADADAIFLFGKGFDYTLDYGKETTFSKEAKVVHIDTAASLIGRNRKAEVGIVGDINSTVKKMVQEAKRMPLKWERESWIGTLRKRRQKFKERLKDWEKKYDGKPIHPRKMWLELKKGISKDAIITVDGGSIPNFGNEVLEIRQPGQWVRPGALATLGAGLPFAIATKLANPEREVINVAGDGAFGYMATELDTAVRHGINVVCVVGNDSSWGMIESSQTLQYGKDRVIGAKLRTSRYEKVAEALGAYGEFVEEPEEILPALGRALQSRRPACINVVLEHVICAEMIAAYGGVRARPSQSEAKQC